MRTHQQRQKRARRLLLEPLEQRNLLAPVAVNDSYAVNEDEVLTVPLVNGVLSNDIDPQGFGLSFSVGAAPCAGKPGLWAGWKLHLYAQPRLQRSGQFYVSGPRRGGAEQYGHRDDYGAGRE